MSSCECPRVTVETRGAGSGPKLISFVEKQVFKKVECGCRSKEKQNKNISLVSEYLTYKFRCF